MNLQGGAARDAASRKRGNMEIRLATKNDIKEISGLFTEFYAYNAMQPPKYYAASTESGQYPGAVIDSHGGDIIVAVIDGAIVGFLHIEEDKTPPYPSVAAHRFACIVDFIVTEHHRKAGIGHKLLEEARQWARARQLEYLELMVLENNDIGRSFYERENFSVVSQTMRLDI